MNDALLDRITPVTRRLRRIRFWDALAGIALVAGVSGWLLRQQVVEGRVAGTTLALVLLGVVAAVAMIAAIFCRLSYRDPRVVAKQIEEKFPGLDQRLLTALSQKDNELGYLQQRVIKEARDHSRTHRWADAVPLGKVVWSRLSGLGATLFLAVVLIMLSVAAPNPESTGAAASIDEPFDVEIVPGDTEVERGTSLVVTARFHGWVPDEADLVCVSQDGSERRITMQQNLDDPVVGGFVSSVDQSFTYRVVTPDYQSEVFSVGVYEHPSLVRSDANLEYPPYTGLGEKRIEDTLRVSAVEGTQVTWTCFLNKPVTSAQLVARDGSRIDLIADEDSPDAVSATLDLRETQRLKLELVDEAGRKNKYPPELVARVLPNKPPSLKLTAAGDTSVSPLEELPIAAEVRDDFGVAKVGLAYTFATEPPREITLAQEIPRGAKSAIEHMIEFEELRAEPDQLLSYHFWAEDFGPDGELRRTQSDMYFAEVRPFEEIFREGQPPPGGQSQPQSQNGQQAEQLAELQKEIINATWRVIRDERGVKPSEKYNDNVTLLRDSQADALGQLEELASEISDAQSLQYVDEVRGQMQKAIHELTTASNDSDVTPLHPAMAAEQAAYGGLLKLRAREFQIVRSQQQQSQGQSSSSQQRRQQQIDELEIKQDENRYQTQQQAEERSEEEQQQREIRQVLNRLRELARRQEDLNKELAQLQSALEQAETEEEREEIQRQLKRLREQQQDLLRETDELNERMQSPENQEEMAEASERLEETRENVRRASEALQQNDASEALTAGRRAEREFEEMRDEFREKAAGQFNEAVRQMRNDAQELDQRQQDLSEKLDEMNQPQNSTGLRGADDREEVENELEGQRERLGELLEQMQETVEQAETAEPLLAQKLYDSFRRTHQRQTERQLTEAAELLRQGFDPQARDAEDAAAEGIDQLREELEQAASSVLGDQTKALERALSELERLERDLNSEIERNNPQASQQGQPGEPSGEEQPGGEPSPQGSQPSQEPRDASSQPPGGNQQGEPSENESDPQDSQSQQPGGQSQQPQSQPSQGEPQPQSQPRGQQQGDPSGEGQPNEGQPNEGQPSEGQPSEGQPNQGQPNDPSSRQPTERSNQSGGQQNRTGGVLNRYAAENPQAAPLTGDDFRDWSDGLRDVEELVEDPELRSQAARVRDRARDVRLEFRRHSKEPQWELVDKLIAQPLRELKRNVSEELLRRSAEKHAPVPIDRDPVPAEYTDAVRKYYESLGSGR